MGGAWFLLDEQNRALETTIVTLCSVAEWNETSGVSWFLQGSGC